MRPSSSVAKQNEYQSQITETALAHHLVSQYTSLVAVDVTPTRPADVQSNTQKVADPVPKGTSNQLVQSPGSLPQTATSAPIKIITGIILLGLAICMYLLTRRKVVFQNYYP
jgi:Ca-activated chloride channel family protein